MGVQVTETGSPRGATGRILLALAAGAAVALSLGIYGTVHDPTGSSLVSLFFTATIHLKVWFATAAIALATFQLLTALRMYGKLGRRRGPRWIPRAHRLSGVAAFWLTIPVAYHCLWSLGFQAHSGTRIWVHGIAGCFFFGALTSKVVIVRSPRMPNWVLPVAGGAVFTALVVVWSTSALWFFRTQGVHL
jgi:Family of unknown function (DUF6529)